MAPSPLLLHPFITLLLLPLPVITTPHHNPNPNLPFVINTWSGPFTAATDAAFHTFTHPNSTTSSTPALDAIISGCTACEHARCDGTVGRGGSPDESCETTLDALIIDGRTLNSGAVGSLRRIPRAIEAARAVLEHTRHSLLVGDLATQFAVEMGLGPEEGLEDVETRERCEEWRRGGCRGNYRVGVEPDPEGGNCGPYRPVEGKGLGEDGLWEGRGWQARADGLPSHDTLSMVVIDGEGAMAAGTTTNGAAFKVPGRVGDGPIVGSGSYVDGEVGGCGATGDGDIMMRFLPCYQAVENLRQGMAPTEAAEDAVRRMLRRYPKISSGIVVVDKEGRHGAAASGWTFSYSFRGGTMNATEVVTIAPLAAGLTSGSKVNAISDEL